MPNKLQVTVRFFPEILLIGVFVVVSLLPRPVPEVSIDLAPVSLSGPIRLYFSEPLISDGISDKIRLTREGASLPFTLELAPDGAALFPREPLLPDTRYELALEPLLPLGGAERTEPLFFNFVTKKQTLLFLGQNKRLVIHGAHENDMPITDESIEVSDFHVGPEGRFAAFYQKKDNNEAVGILLGSMRPSGLPVIHLLPPKEKTRSVDLLLCDRGDLLVVASAPDDDWPTLSAFAIDWEARVSNMIRPIWERSGTGIYDKSDVTCSPHTARLAYKRNDDTIISTFIGEDDGESIGSFDALLGFFNRDRLLVAEKILTTASGTNESSLEFLGQNSGGVPVSEDDILLSSFSMSEDGKRFVVIATDHTSALATLSLYEQKEGLFEKVKSWESDPSLDFLRTTLSPDGQDIILEVSDETDVLSDAPCLVRLSIDAPSIGECFAFGSYPEWMR